MRIDQDKVDAMKAKFRRELCLAHLATAFGGTMFTSSDFTNAVGVAVSEYGMGQETKEEAQTLHVANTVDFKAMSKAAKKTLVLMALDIIQGLCECTVVDLFHALDGNGIFVGIHEGNLSEFFWPMESVGPQTSAGLTEPDEDEREADAEREDASFDAGDDGDENDLGPKSDE